MERAHILEAFFKKVEEEGFFTVSLESLEKDFGSEVGSLKTYRVPMDFLKALQEEVESKAQSILEEEEEVRLSLKDRLFECFMSRMDILEPYHKGLARVVKDFERNNLDPSVPSSLWAVLSFSLKGMENILCHVGIAPDWPKKIALLIVYGLTLRVWVQDQKNTQEMTLHALDQALDLLFQKYSHFSNGVRP